MLLHIASANPFLWVKSFEYQRVSNKIKHDINTILKSPMPIFCWDIVSGIIDYNTGVTIEESTGLSTQPIDFLKKRKSSCVMITYDYHLYIEQINVWRYVLNSLDNFKSEAKTLINISPSRELPQEINRYVTMLDFSLPSRKELFDTAKKYIDDRKNEIKEEYFSTYTDEYIMDIAKSAVGLTDFELENALSLSLADFSQITKSYIMEQRQQMVKKNGCLELHESKQGFEAVIGLKVLKPFAKKMVLSGNGKGILLLGHPGVAKTLFAKCLGKETNRPTIIFDTGRLMGSLVGQTEAWTEEALNVLESQDEAIVFMDEIEKALSGTKSGSNDSSIRQGKLILQWMNDRKANTYLIATSNDISSLPPEFLRAERWDAIFFLDLPTEDEGREMLDHFCELYKVQKNDVDITNWTGAEIKSLCRLTSSLVVDLKEASKYIQPIYKVSPESIEWLRNWASTRCINASVLT